MTSPGDMVKDDEMLQQAMYILENVQAAVGKHHNHPSRVTDLGSARKQCLKLLELMSDELF